MCCLSKKKLKRKSDVSSEKLEECKVEKKRVHRSSTPIFDFRQLCIFVENGATYKKTVITKGRWPEAFLCRTVSDVDLKQEGQDGPGSLT